jgi:hypothetical protein
LKIRRLLTFPFLLLALFLGLVGGVGSAIHLRARQSDLEQELSQAWQDLGAGLAAALHRLEAPADPLLDPQRLADAVVDTSIQSHLGALGDRIDSLCREIRRTGSERMDFDSLRESLRRDRQKLGLAIANYRGERRSLLGEWVLWGFPER